MSNLCLDKIVNNTKLLNIPIEVFETDIFEVAAVQVKSPCYLCARMRRGHLYNKAEELGFYEYLRFKRTGPSGNGHQIGIEVHELPWLKRECDQVLLPGMVFCSEPKMMFPEECYVRVEDMILITEDGAVSLTNFPRDLFEIL